MADDGNTSNKPKTQRPQETFHRAQETQVEHKFPDRTTGIVVVPLGSRGPKSLYLKRHGESFGFTLRHFIVYPPDSVVGSDGRHAAVGALCASMDTIFVKHVKDRSPAQFAGLQCGDRIVGVNRVAVTDKTYAQVVQLIQNSPEYLHLLVVPKEEDVLQRYFAETAYNPASNQHQRAEYPSDRQKAQRFLTKTFSQLPREFQVDAFSWSSLRNSYDYNNPIQRSADNLDERTKLVEYNDTKRRQKARAQPQVPPYHKMGRRASDGCALSDREYYEQPEYDMVRMKAIYKPNYLPSEGQGSEIARYPNTAGCRLSLDAGRRESSSSLTSSLADGSKDSLSSYDSNSTLTGHETDDSALMTRFRKSFQKKEEFLKMAPDANLIQKEFYGRPKKLERAMWPPDSPSKNLTKPIHQNFQRVKNDIDIERDLQGAVPNNFPQQKSAKSPKDKAYGNLERIKEGYVAPIELLNGSYDDDETLQGFQMVHKLTKEFESGRPGPEDDRTRFYRSELARLSSKKIVPNVTERTQEYERNKERPSSPVKKISKSLDSSGNNSSSGSINETNFKTLSGNVTISSGSKYIHVPPPSEYGKPTEPENEATYVRARSNSAESWVAALQNKKHERINRQDAVIDDGNKSKVTGEDNKPIVVKRRTKNTNLADDERTMRRESYLKATEGGRMHFDSDLSDGDLSPHVLRSAHRRWRPPMFPGDIQQLRKMFEDAASSLGGSVSGDSSSSTSLDRERTNVIKEGSLHCKITEIDGKRFGDRSWKPIWACLRGPKLFLYKDKHHQSPMETSDAVEHSLASGVDMRASVVRVAEDYTKRKHVLRVSSVNPCRSEFLLQAESTEELADWVKALQEQMSTSTDNEAKIDLLTGNKQQAVPQTIPAVTTFQVQGSQLSPQPTTKSKSSASRNRSPTGQSPVSKTRKPSQVSDPATSPKLKTWRGRVAKQFRKMQGASSPSSPTAPEGSTFGIPLDQCLASNNNPYLPQFVEVCTEIVDARGLQTVGIYRVPGNNASITALTEEVNRNYDFVPVDDPRWNDLHVVSSLLKSYFRKIPDSLVTNAMYPCFIKSDKIENPEVRMRELKRLIKSLPPHNYHTLRHIILHLKRVVDNADVNKMEAKNLAIVFGPNLVRAEEDNMESMVNNMTHQCKIVETLITCAEWFFLDDTEDAPVPAVFVDTHDDSESVPNQAFLLDNISKYEAFKDKEKNSALFSSIISAAHRKVKKKSTKGSGSLNESKEEVTSPSDLKDVSATGGKTGVIPTTVTDIEKNKRAGEKVPWFNYSTDQEDFHRRIENFEQETKAMLQMPRNLEISVNNMAAKQGNLSSSASNVNQRLAAKPTDSHLLKTHSASNVFSRTISVVDRNSLINSIDNSYSGDKNFSSLRSSNQQYSDLNKNVETSGAYKGAFSDSNDRRNGRFTLRRGSSVENLNSSSMDLNANGVMKKVRYENENERVGSLDSLNKEDDSDLVTSLTKLYDKKLMEKKSSAGNQLKGEDFPFADESPEKTKIALQSDKENVPDPNDSYRNPSLHKSTVLKETTKNDIMEKDEDSMERVPEKIFKTKLKRSESLNKPERALSPLNTKLKRSESLNKGDKLKRSDSLTKNEKTESNLNKRREMANSVRRKDVVKLKRKNGMPDRSIKRRHTVGGTKDPDKVTWLDNKNQQEITANKENKEKNLRTSSPDLSTTRREKLFLEINFIAPEEMVMALKQHLMGARPQSFPDTTLFKVPLESHV